MKNDKIVKPFGFKDKIGYMFGDFGNDLTFLLSSSFLMKFYTDVMDVDGYIVGIIMMIARFVDAFTDVAMGRICDKSKMTAAGKFKPWIRRMCGPVAIVSFLMYQSSLSGLPKPAKIAYLFFLKDMQHIYIKHIEELGEFHSILSSNELRPCILARFSL